MSSALIFDSTHQAIAFRSHRCNLSGSKVSGKRGGGEPKVLS